MRGNALQIACDSFAGTVFTIVGFACFPPVHPGGVGHLADAILNRVKNSGYSGKLVG